MSSNPDQTQEVHDTSLPALSTGLDESESKAFIRKCYRRIKDASGKWPWEWLSQDYRPLPQDWTCDDALAMAELFEHTCNYYSNVLIPELSSFFQKTGTFDVITETRKSTNVPLHCEQAKAFINSIGDHRLTTTPSRGGESLTLPLVTPDSDSSDEAKTTSRKRKRSHNMLSTPNHEISQNVIIPKGYVDSGTTMSDAPLDHPLRSMAPLSRWLEDRIQHALGALETHELSKKGTLYEIASINPEFVPGYLKRDQEKRNVISDSKYKSTVEVSSAKQQALEQCTDCKQEEPDVLAGLEKDLPKPDARVRDLLAELEKAEKSIKLCRESIENAGYPVQVVILRHNLRRLCAANLVALSPADIKELSDLVGRFLAKKYEEGWA